MSDIPTLNEVAGRVRRLAAEMKEVAVIMDYYGGFPFQRHAKELLGAAAVAEGWAEGMTSDG